MLTRDGTTSPDPRLVNSAQCEIALNALCISIGYFLCEAVGGGSRPEARPFMARLCTSVRSLRSELAALRVSKMGLFFGVYRLTTELSTPFTNQRWFYRTVGYTPDRRRVALVTLVFSILFAITRNFMVFPYWLFVYVIYGTPKHAAAREQLPYIDVPLFATSLTLDVLNIYWALTVYPIGYKAAYMLYKADWRSDIDRARDRIRCRFLSARRRAMNTKLIASLQRSASFNRIHKAILSPSRMWEEWSIFSEGLSEPELDAESTSGQTTPLRRFSDGDSASEEDSSGGAVFEVQPTANTDDSDVDGMTLNFRGRRKNPPTPID
ncbi:unnamed protein product [Mesocestoides corti]|uniref:TLC domain-containing protein n=1 Tax=Mesocestoides corti TaxID=53468 RepID=A0A3P6GGL3_MESCO|nr:unnamed protein product [Mesocestoides corti]